MPLTQPQFSSIRVCAADGAESDLRVVAPAHPHAALYFLPALGVGIRPNETFAAALAARGVAVAIHEWRGLGGSNRRASRGCSWGYRELLDQDIPAGLAAARSALSGLEWAIGGHSLGGQLALISAALRPQQFRQVQMLASGMPDWRSYPRLRGLGIWAALHFIPATSIVLGHYPGESLGFAGREARGLMRDWARSGRSGRYRLRDGGEDIETVLSGYQGRVHALHMASDWLCPKSALHALADKTPQARWSIETVEDAEFAPRRADHFGWLKTPGPVVERITQALPPAS